MRSSLGCWPTDLDGACELVSADVELDIVPMRSYHGADALKAFFASTFGELDALEVIVHRQAATGNVVMHERTNRMFVGDTPHDLLVAGVFEVNEEGKIRLFRDYFDMAVTNAAFPDQDS